MSKDYTQLAKNVASGMIELFEAMKESPHVTNEEKERYARILVDYSNFIENEFIDGKSKEPIKESSGVSTPEQGGRKTIPAM